MAFSVTSRYYNLETGTYQAEDGRIIPYLLRRFLPPTDLFTPITTYTVKENERLDNITARFLGDPEQFWRVCDANGFMRAEELTEEPGRSVSITLPQGIPGTPHV